MDVNELLDKLASIAEPEDPYEESEIVLMQVMEIAESLITVITKEGVTQ